LNGEHVGRQAVDRGGEAIKLVLVDLLARGIRACGGAEHILEVPRRHGQHERP
jgi:hypothetical protein